MLHTRTNTIRPYTILHKDMAPRLLFPSTIHELLLITVILRCNFLELHYFKENCYFEEQLEQKYVFIKILQFSYVAPLP